jgi:hypothetical protein
MKVNIKNSPLFNENSERPFGMQEFHRKHEKKSRIPISKGALNHICMRSTVTKKLNILEAQSQQGETMVDPSQW